MLDNLGVNEQMIFTTHNTDMLDLNLPKHTYAFLRKKEEDGEYKTTVMYASDNISLSELFQFCLVIIAIISLCMQAKKK